MNLQFLKIASSYSSRRINNVFILLLITLMFVSTIEFLSILTFLLFLVITCMSYRLLFSDKDISLIIILFCVYTLIAIIFYWFQYWQFPVNGGCTGAGIHGGTDDLFYFQESINKGISYRGDRSMEMHHYSKFLQVFYYIIGSFKKVNLLDLLFVNILAFSFIPVVTEKLAEMLKMNEKSRRLAFLMTASCPILMINGLVLVRDAWTALFLVLAIYFLLERKLLPLFFTLLITFYLRVSSAGIIMLFLAVILLFSEKEELSKYNFQNRTFYIGLLIIFVLINLTAVIYFLKFTTLLDSLFFRKDFLSFIQETSHTKSAANFIYNLQPSLRIPMSFVFYLGSPFLSLNEVIFNNTLTIRAFFEQIFPFLFVFYFIYLVQFFDIFIKLRKTKIISLLFITFMLSVLILSQLSMQPRHKTMIMPVFYLIVAYGSQNKSNNSKIIGFMIIIPIFFLEVLYNFL